MNHITQEQAFQLAEKSGFFFQDVGYSPTFHTMPLEYSQKCFERLCNAAIEWHIAQQAAREPVAYFDFQKHGFRWAQNMSIGAVPVSVRVERTALRYDKRYEDRV